ncbi:MAG: HlyD family type I secretion periplasmic adaptor subunit [Magnetococcales bacterium]|nr:HlyD family type I secretion periplasmic adaptor subunit [Magnetococcales bacterium]
MSEVAAARWRGLNPMAHGLLFLVASFFIFIISWAYFAELDEVTNGMGRVIPSSQVQIVQNFEGGILSEIHVAKGDMVEKDQVLLRIDNIQSQASLEESSSRLTSLRLRAMRLDAELENKPFDPPKKLSKGSEELVRSEKAVMQSRRLELEANINIRSKQVEQRRQELIEMKAMVEQIRRRLKLARQEMTITAPMVEQGIMSEVELLRLKREVSELEGSMETTTLAIPRIRSSLNESKRKVEEATLAFRTRTFAELNETREEIDRLSKSHVALKDRVTRTEVRSPVRGAVIRVRVNTIGQVVRSGMDLVEIMPLDDSLLIEAQIRPQDIAFIRPGQQTMVKFTAYDFSIYGGLFGILEHISADTITDEQGENFYQIQVRTKENHLKKAGRVLPIIPGMVATVDILTGKKSVLDYLLKPILKAKHTAMRER